MAAREEHFSPEARQQMGLPPIHAHRDGDEYAGASLPLADPHPRYEGERERGALQPRGAAADGPAADPRAPRRRRAPTMVWRELS